MMISWMKSQADMMERKNLSIPVGSQLCRAEQSCMKVPKLRPQKEHKTLHSFHSAAFLKLLSIKKKGFFFSRKTHHLRKALRTKLGANSNLAEECTESTKSKLCAPEDAFLDACWVEILSTTGNDYDPRTHFPSK